MGMSTSLYILYIVWVGILLISNINHHSMSLYIFLKKCLFKFLAHFLVFVVVFQDFPIYHELYRYCYEYQFLIRYIYVICFLSFYGLLYYSTDSIFSLTFFNFIKYNMFLCVSVLMISQPRYHCQIQYKLPFYSILSSKRFIVLGHEFSFIHFRIWCQVLD